MPTYSNTGSTAHNTIAGIFWPGMTGFSVLQNLDGLDGVTRTSDEPYMYIKDGLEPIDLLSPATASATSEPVSIGAGSKLTFAVDGALAAGEEIAIEYQAASGDWFAFVEDGLPVVLSADNNVVATDKPAIYRTNKPITAAAVGVTVYR